MTPPRAQAVRGLKVGDQFTIRRQFSQQEVLAFAHLSRDYNPVHSDEQFAQLKGLREPIAHGLLTASLLTEIGGQLGWLASEMSFRFRRPVYVGDQLSCHWIISEIDAEGRRAKADVSIVNEEGTVVLLAQTSGMLPDDPQRTRLAELLEEGDPFKGQCSQLVQP